MEAPAAGRRPAQPDNPAIPPDNGASADRLKGVAASRRMGRHQDAVGPRDQELRRLSGAQGQGAGRARHPRHRRHGRLGPRRRRLSSRRKASSRSSPTCCRGKARTAAAPRSSARDVGQAIRSLTPDDVACAAERGDGIRQVAAGLQRQDRGDRVLLGRQRELQLRDRAARAQRGGRLLRHAADEDGRRHAGRRSGAVQKIKAPVIGFYGGNDARVTSTVEPTASR